MAQPSFPSDTALRHPRPRQGTSAQELDLGACQAHAQAHDLLHPQTPQIHCRRSTRNLMSTTQETQPNLDQPLDHPYTAPALHGFAQCLAQARYSQLTHGALQSLPLTRCMHTPDTKDRTKDGRYSQARSTGAKQRRMMSRRRLCSGEASPLAQASAHCTPRET